MDISLFLKVKEGRNSSYFSDDTLIYQAILTGLTLLDAMYFINKSTFCNALEDLNSRISKKDLKNLYEDGINHLYDSGSLYLFVTTIKEYNTKHLSWTCSIPKDTILPVVSHILPSLAIPFTFSGNRGDFTEIHITNESLNFIEYISSPYYRTNKAEYLTKYYVDETKNINCIEWKRSDTCARIKMEGWKYLSFNRDTLINKPVNYGIVGPILFSPGSLIDSKTTRTIWITKVRGNDNIGKNKSSLYTYKYVPYFPEKISDIRDILLKIYKNGSKITSSADTRSKTFLEECEDDYVESLTKSLRHEDNFYKSRIKEYFNNFLSYKVNLTDSREDIITREMKQINNSKDKKMKDGMFGNMMEKFKSMIVPVTDPNLKITMDGNVAVRNADGDYVSIDADDELVNYPADFTIAVPIYVMKKPFASIQLGEIVKKGNSYAKVIDKNPDGTLKCLSFTGYTTTKKGIVDFMLGTSYADVVVNIMNIQNAGINPMILALMNSDGNMSSKEMMMFMMMSGGMNMNNGMNPLMFMMLAGDKEGGDSSMSKMLEVLMMSQMFGGGNMGGMNNMMGGMNNMMGDMNMFRNQGSQMSNPFQMFGNFGKPGKKNTQKRDEEDEVSEGPSAE